MPSRITAESLRRKLAAEAEVERRVFDRLGFEFRPVDWRRAGVCAVLDSPGPQSSRCRGMGLLLGALLGAVLSAVTSVVITIWIERLRQPKLRLSIETPIADVTYTPPRHATQARFVRIWVSNEAPSGWLSWINRSPALQCRAEITFHHLDGQNVFGRTMPGRWAGSPEPTTIPIVGPSGVQYQLIDFTRLTTDSRIDILPGEGTALDVAARFDAEVECYGWSNETYFISTPWRNPNWRLEHGRYLVRVVVFTGGQRYGFEARLINDVSRSDFRLEG